MSEGTRWKQRFHNYAKALNHLKDAINELEQRELSDLEKEGIIQRFEYTHELSWKLLKDFLEYKGVRDMIGSKDVIRQAITNGLIENQHQIWMDMIDERNKSPHSYNKDILNSVLKRIVKDFYPQFEEMLLRFKKEQAKASNA